MRKITYILVTLILLISLTTINIFAEEVNKASIGQKIFAQSIENNEITINNNEEEDFAELDAIIGDNEISDEEMSKVVGEVGHSLVLTGSHKPCGGVPSKNYLIKERDKLAYKYRLIGYGIEGSLFISGIFTYGIGTIVINSINGIILYNNIITYIASKGKSDFAQVISLLIATDKIEKKIQNRH